MSESGRPDLKDLEFQLVGEGELYEAISIPLRKATYPSSIWVFKFSVCNVRPVASNSKK